MRPRPSRCSSIAAFAFLGVASVFTFSNAGQAADSNPRPAEFQVDAAIFGLLVQPDGQILVPGQSVRLRADGSIDPNYVLQTSGRVEAFALQPDGKMVLAHSSGVDVLSDEPPLLRRYNNDGTEDDSFKATLPEIDVVSDVAIQSDAKIVVAGYVGFRAAQSDPSFPPPRLKLFRFHPDGTADTSFRPAEVRSAGARPSFALQPDGKIMVPSGEPPYLVRLDPSGARDGSFAAPDGYRVFNFVLGPDGKITASGPNPHPGDIGVSRLYRLLSNGELDSSFNPPRQYVFDRTPLAVQSDRRILAVVFRPEARDRAVVRLLEDGTIDPSYNAPADFGVLTITPGADGRVLLTGTFGQIQGPDRTGIARLNPDGSVDRSFQPIFTRPGRVLTLATQFDKVIVGGEFSRINGKFAGSVARLDADGILDPTFGTQVIAGTTLRIETQSDGRIVLLNDVVTSGESFFTGLVRLQVNGALDPTFKPDDVSLFNTFTVQPDDKLIVVVNNATLRLNADGSRDTNFITIQNRYTVNGVKAAADGRFMVFGRSDIGVIQRRFPDGRIDSTFEDPGADKSINAVDFQADGKLLIGGDFRFFGYDPNFADNIISRPYVARLQDEGTVDEAFSAVVNAPVSVLKVQRSGDIIIGGTFTSVNGFLTPGVARLKPDGRFDPTFSVNTEGGAVTAITELPSGKVLVAGDFGVVSSVVSPLPGQILAADAVVPFTTVVVAQDLSEVAAVRFLVNGNVVDVAKAPLVSSPGPRLALKFNRDPLNAGIPGTGVYGTTLGGLIPGTYVLTVQVVDSSGGVSESSSSKITVVDPTKAPPPATYQIGSVVTGEVAAIDGALVLTARPTGAGGALRRISLAVNGTTVQQITPDAPNAPKPAPDGSYTFTYTPPALGSYAVVVIATATNGVTSTSPVVAVTAAPPSKVVNVSTRMFSDTGENVLIGGVIITGSGSKRLAVRAIGPSLSAAGVAGALPDPVLQLRDGNGATIASNDNWRSDQAAAITAAGLQPRDDREAAVIAAVAPGNYTAVVQGANASTGVALVEAYDLDSAAVDAKLANISTRGQVSVGERVMIGGFIIGEGADKVVMIRAIGPSLGASGVTGALGNPKLELYGAGGTIIATNDDWGTTQIGGIIEADQKEALVATTIPPKDERESAILVRLKPGFYTAVVRGAGDQAGVGLVEVYDLD